MSLLAYAFAESDAGAAEGAGLDDRPLIAIEHDGVALVASCHCSRPPAPTAETLWRYEEIVERLMGREPILPARFGSVLADEEQARSTLRERHEELRRGLERVRGAVELGIRASWEHAPTPPAARSGTEYMLGHLDVHRRAQRAAEKVAPLRELARSSKVKVLPRPSVPLLGAYLVDRERTEEFLEVAAELDTAFEDGHLVCTGPWPPYSFAQAATVDQGPKGGEP
jgi:hypothetical protein